MLLILIDLSLDVWSPRYGFNFLFSFSFFGWGEDSNKLQILRVGLVVWLVKWKNGRIENI